MKGKIKKARKTHNYHAKYVLEYYPKNKKESTSVAPFLNLLRFSKITEKTDRKVPGMYMVKTCYEMCL